MRAPRHDGQTDSREVGINQAQLEMLNGEEDPVDEVVALPATTKAAAADHSQSSYSLSA